MVYEANASESSHTGGVDEEIGLKWVEGENEDEAEGEQDDENALTIH